MGELAALGGALADGRDSVQGILAASAAAAAARKASAKVHDAAVAQRIATVSPALGKRGSAFIERAKIQHERFRLPRFPTTTIGSFPQTTDVRNAPRRTRQGRAQRCRLQDVPAKPDRAPPCLAGKYRPRRAGAWRVRAQRHGAVFGEQLAGFAFTKHAGCNPTARATFARPVLFGDVSRPRPMTVDLVAIRAIADKTADEGDADGPVTILNWSFVRDDIPRSTACRQIALAIRDEVADLEAAGAGMIQIDEAALREGLPLRKSEWQNYLDWAWRAFVLFVRRARRDTDSHPYVLLGIQRHHRRDRRHGCRCDLDRDVAIKNGIARRLQGLPVPNEIGPGVYDIHSPRVPEIGEMTDLLKLARRGFPMRNSGSIPTAG